MNNLIKEIFLKHIKEHAFLANEKRVLNEMFKEVCDLQIQHCANLFFPHTSEKIHILKNSENIAT